MKHNTKTVFDDLFVLDLANNHQGDIDHAQKLIDQLILITKKKKIKAAIKFQFRQLKSFIHPDFKNNKEVKHIQRFESTELKFKDYELMVAKIKDSGLITMSTPFDEESIEIMERLDIDILKIASCSFNDYPLLQAVLKTNFPVIASTGGSSMSEIDNFVSIFENHEKLFALNHCIPIYPTPRSKLELNQIDSLKKRFPNITIGWSTHEDPNDVETVKLAYAKGARMFERHVGLNTEKYKLNNYSSNPSQTEKWIDAYIIAKESCGARNRPPQSVEEKSSLSSLYRGVYAKEKINIGDTLTKDKVYFAMPCIEGKLSSNNWRDNLVANKIFSTNEALDGEIANKSENNQSISSIVMQTNGLLREAGIKISSDWEYEISHHYGLQRFREFGAILIDIINRDYCKKLIIQLPRQKHPYHFHKRKEETFHVLHGDLEIEKNGEPKTLKPGNLFIVKPQEWHKFSTINGVVFEEISTTAFKDDSFYEDETINKAGLNVRKTKIKLSEAI